MVPSHGERLPHRGGEVVNVILATFAAFMCIVVVGTGLAALADVLAGEI